MIHTVMKFVWYAIGTAYAIVYLVSLASGEDCASNELIGCFLGCFALANIESFKEEI